MSETVGPCNPIPEPESGFERFFIDLDQIARHVPAGPQCGAEIGKMMPKYDTTPLGPPPPPPRRG
jgi:hypothetical protein